MKIPPLTKWTRTDLIAEIRWLRKRLKDVERDKSFIVRAANFLLSRDTKRAGE